MIRFPAWHPSSLVESYDVPPAFGNRPTPRADVPPLWLADATIEADRARTFVGCEGHKPDVPELPA